MGEAQPDLTLAQLSQRYQTVLLRHFQRRGVHYHDAQDLVQETFTRLTKHESLEELSPIDGYLFTTANNIARDYFRKRKVRAAAASEGLLDDILPEANFTPDRVFEGRQELAGIVEALNEMPERMRNILILARLERLPRAEIAARLGISKRLVEQQITLATACLADRRRRLT